MAHANSKHQILLAVLPLAEAAGQPAWLDAGEQARLDGMASPLRRRQFLAGHGLARRLAESLAGRPAGEWRWSVDDGQRRRLVHVDGEALFVSVSHSGDHVAAAVGRKALGLDLECDPRERDWAGLARSLFEPSLVDGVGADPAAFRRAWALAEAEAKRSGDGIQRAWLRRLLMEPANRPDAEAWTWPLAGQGTLALAAWPGATVEGGPGVPQAWRYRLAG
ncbi:MAG: hypothetical protein ABS41_05905 [Arenimonas sp. SCN 70-307]|uniref:4'-phosphopantetheinyl transferase family protein n=1 Tax=Arenimonas sp. SCN 70-307 TaxID=1660089 RepID=UPI00086D21CB|nr:hypothetical protein [Arenimonas sp. SCN 70-307]ODS63377.1 MAG: hypothetical protein ABS41_05905 [Arenimonas sp. SCN 70-307]